MTLRKTDPERWSKAPSTVVLGNAPLLSEEMALLEAVSLTPNSRIFTANMAFLSEATRHPWAEKTAILQDYVYQAVMDQDDASEAKLLHDTFTRIIIIESLFPDVRYGEFDYSKVRLLSHVGRVRLLNRAAKTRLFRFDEEYLPSSGIIALALAIDQNVRTTPDKALNLVGINLNPSSSYTHEVSSPNSLQRAYSAGFDKHGREVINAPRNHSRPDSLAVAVLSYHYDIFSVRPEIVALTTTWSRGNLRGPQNDLDEKHSLTDRLSKLSRDGLRRIRRGGVRSAFQLLLRQARHSRRL